MSLYFSKRLLLAVPTLFVILLLNFLIIQTAPGGPVERFLAQMNHSSKLQGEVAGNAGFASNIFSESAAQINANNSLKYNGSSGVDAETLAKIEKLYGFDLSLSQRFFLMLKKFIKFDFGESFYQNKKVTDLILEKLPTSISLGLWSLILTYAIGIPLGIKKALQDGSKFDVISSTIVTICYALPGFLLAIFFIIFFCGGNFLNLFPLRGLTSPNFAELNLIEKILDYFWHLTLPIICMTIGGFASLTFFVKNSFLEEISKNYVICAAAKGLNKKQIIYRHVFRNAMLVIIAGLPAALLGIFFTSSMLIEVIFSLDGLGLMGYEAVLSRDYPVIFASLFIFTILGLLMNIISDLAYKIVDPRINFNKF